MEPSISTTNAHGRFTTSVRVYERLMTWSRRELRSKLVQGRKLAGCEADDPKSCTKRYWKPYTKAELAIMVGDAFGAEF